MIAFMVIMRTEKRLKGRSVQCHNLTDSMRRIWLNHLLEHIQKEFCTLNNYIATEAQEGIIH